MRPKLELAAFGSAGVTTAQLLNWTVGCQVANSPCHSEDGEISGSAAA